MAALILFALSATGSAQAAAPQILNSTQWLESTSAATNGAPSGSRQVTVTLMVKHDIGRHINRLKIDEDYDGSDNTNSKGVRNLSTSEWQQPNIIGGYGYTRVTYTFDTPAGSNLNCPFIGSGTDDQDRPLRIRAIDDSGQESATANATIRFVRYDCNAREDHPALYQRGQDKTSITPGETVNFTFTADDSDGGLTANRDFGGLNYRFRRLGDGATTGATKQCYGNSDNTQRTLSHTFSRRGHWVLEAELLNNSDCNHNPNPGGWWRIGSVDVNSPAAGSPTMSLGASVPGTPARPQINGNFTVTATVNDPSDSGEGGVAQDIEWDLDGNNSYDDASLGDWKTGLTVGQRQRTISTNGLAPGLYTVRARVGDNGSLGGADDIRRTKVATMQYLVDTPPVALPDSHRTISGDSLPFVLSGTDADSDPLTYSIATPPAHGTLSGSGANLSYEPDPGFAGMDSLEFEVDDGYGGTATATVDIRVDPDLRPFDGPAGTLDSRGGAIEFNSSATGATFECQLDDDVWQPCTSPFEVTDLPDGAHTLRARVSAGGLTNPDISEAAWTVDAFPKVQVNNGPAGTTDQTGAAVDFTLSEDGATTAPTSECQLDDLAWASCSSPIGYEDLDDGPHTIRVRATDAFGKQTVEQVDWTVLTDGGSTAIEAPLPVSYTRQTTAQVNFSVSGPSDHAECSLDGDAWQTCTSPVDLTGLSEGSHTLRVRSVNQLGNPSPQPAQISWTVDRTIPVATITAGPQGPTPNGPAAFTFESSESLSSFECKVDSGAYAPCTSPFQLPSGLEDGPHSFRVAAIDRAGNRSLAPQRDFTLLSVAPAVEFTSGPAQGQVIRATAATFGFEAAAPAAGFECSVDEGDYLPCASPTAVTGLADGDHSISIRSIDEVGNRSADAATRSWTVDATPPGTAITSGPAANSGSAEASFAFSASEPGSSFECSLDGAPFAACTSPQDLEGLSDGNHQFRVRATDAAGNTDPTPASQTWKVDTTDPGPPDPPLTDPETLPCAFDLVQERCGDPYLIGSARADYRKRKGKGQISFEVSSGGAALSKILAKTPAGLGTKAFSGKSGRKVGRVILTGNSKQTINLKLPKKVKAANLVAGNGGGTKVTLKKRSVVITDLPEGVTGAKIKIKSGRGLGISASVCGTRNWRVILTDTGSTSRQVNAMGDTNCVRKGTR